MEAASEPGTVLAVGAHPDDIEILCAGTLALLRQRGWRVVMATMTPGDLSANTQSRDEIARVRLEQARRSAAILQADYHCLESADFRIFFSDAPCRRATGLIRATRPDLVLTHSTLDRLADHEETSRIVRQACFSAPAKNYRVKTFAGGEKPIRRTPHLYYCDPTDGQDFLGYPVRAALIVDISSVITIKEQMLAQHAGQRDSFRQHHASDEYLDHVRRWSRRRGQQVGCTYGEGFHQHVGRTYPGDNLLKAALGDLVHLVPEST